MGLIFAYDFETTGKPDFQAPADAPHQPHIVEAAALLVNEDTRQVEAQFSAVGFPFGWEIPEEAAAIHGITTEHARRVGIPEAEIVRVLHQLWLRAQYRIAHSETFDCRIMRTGMLRFGFKAADAEAFKAGEARCTGQGSRSIVALPKSKMPTLAEAFGFFTGTTFEDRHRALPDTLACLTVHWGVVDHYGGTLPAKKPKPSPSPAPAAPRPASSPNLTIRPMAAPALADDDGLGFLS